MTHIQTMIRVINAWDSTTLPKNKDGRLWQMIEEMRQALEEALANHIPDTTKMVSGVKDSLTTQQEQRKCNNCGEFGECCQKQEQGEPVAWQERQARRMQDGVVTEWTNWYPCRYRTIDEAQAEACDHIPYEWRPLYTTPQQRKQEQGEPVAWRGYNWGHSPDDWVYRDFDDPILDGNGNNVGQPLYTTPQQRKPLTDEQIDELAEWHALDHMVYEPFARAIEAAHGITASEAEFSARSKT